MESSRRTVLVASQISVCVSCTAVYLNVYLWQREVITYYPVESKFNVVVTFYHNVFAQNGHCCRLMVPVVVYDNVSDHCCYVIRVACDDYVLVFVKLLIVSQRQCSWTDKNYWQSHAELENQENGHRCCWLLWRLPARLRKRRLYIWCNEFQSADPSGRVV